MSIDLSQYTKVIPDTLTLLTQALTNEIEARVVKLFAEREAELNKLRAEVFALKDEASMTLATATKYFKRSRIYDEDYVTRRLKQFLDSKEFEEVVGQYFTDNWTGMQGVENPDIVTHERVHATICDILQRTAFVVHPK